MKYSPKDICQYVRENELEAQFMNSVMNHVGNFTIAEITDKKLQRVGDHVNLKSKMYSIDVDITDEEIVTAVANGIYVSTFYARLNDSFQVHFLVHMYPESMKPQYEEEIFQDVLWYMIKKTILTLRLDTPEKIDMFVI